MKEMATSGEVQQFRETNTRLRSKQSNRSASKGLDGSSRQAAMDDRRPMSN